MFRFTIPSSNYFESIMIRGGDKTMISRSCQICQSCIHKEVCKYISGPFCDCDAYVEDAGALVTAQAYPGNIIYVKEADDTIRESYIATLMIHSDDSLHYIDSEGNIFSEEDYRVKFALTLDDLAEADEEKASS